MANWALKKKNAVFVVVFLCVEWGGKRAHFLNAKRTNDAKRQLARIRNDVDARAKRKQTKEKKKNRKEEEEKSLRETFFLSRRLLILVLFSLTRAFINLKIINNDSSAWNGNERKIKTKEKRMRANENASRLVVLSILCYFLSSWICVSFHSSMIFVYVCVLKSMNRKYFNRSKIWQFSGMTNDIQSHLNESEWKTQKEQTTVIFEVEMFSHSIKFSSEMTTDDRKKTSSNPKPNGRLSRRDEAKE